METSELALAAVKEARNKGVKNMDAFIKRDNKFNLSMKEGKVINVTQSVFQGIGIRVVIDKKLGFVHSTDLRKSRINELIDKAVELTSFSEPDPYLHFPPIKQKYDDYSILDPDFSKITLDQKKELLVKLEKSGLKFSDKIKSAAEIHYWDVLTETTIANTSNRSTTYVGSVYGFGGEFVAEEDGNRKTGEFYLQKRFFKDLPKPEWIGRKASLYGLWLLSGEPVESQTVPVVFDPNGAGPALIRWGIGNALKGENVRLNRSFLENKLNEKVASPLFTLLDDGTMDKGVGTAPFDDEGTPTRKTVMIDKGILKSYLFDAVSAAKAGAESTGNAHRDEHNAFPEIGYNNLYMANGDTTVADIIGSIEKGFYVISTMGFGMDSVTGNFSVAAQGRWIKNGQFDHAVSGISLTGKLYDMLNDVDAVGDDLDFTDDVCNCPTFRIKKMQISGI